MKKILIAVGVLVALLILFAVGNVWYEYHDEDQALSKSEQIVSDMETRLSQLESKIQTATRGDPSKAPTDETLKISEQILKIQHNLGVEEMVFGMGSSHSKLISEKRKSDLSARMKTVNEHCNQVLEKYRIPLDVQRRS